MRNKRGLVCKDDLRKEQKKTQYPCLANVTYVKNRRTSWRAKVTYVPLACENDTRKEQNGSSTLACEDGLGKEQKGLTYITMAT